MKFLTIIACLLVISCEFDKDFRGIVNDKLQGTWNVNKWNIDENDHLRLYVSSKFEFNRQNETNGKAVQTTITDSSGYTSILEYNYEVFSNGDSIDMQNIHLGGKYKLSFQGDQVSMNGMVGSHHWYFELTRN